MKKNINKLSALACALTLSMISIATVYAEYNSTNSGSDDKLLIMSSPVNENSISVDGETIEAAKPITTENSVMLPARAVAQALGFEVAWNNDSQLVTLTKIPQYITFQIGVDGYTFARTAPMPLGTAPTLIDGVTYIPVEVISELMSLKVEKIGNSINIITTEKEITDNEENFENNEVYLGEGKIVSINEEEGQILINDTVKGEVVLNIGDLSILKNENGDAVKLSDLEEGNNITVEYSPAMTMSIPPINNPVKVIVNYKNIDEVETAEVSLGKGEITSVNEKENLITVNDTVKGEVILNISEVSIVKNEDGDTIKLSDLKEGASITVAYSPAMTASIPPMNNPVEVIVTSNDTEEVSLSEAKIVSIDEKENQILINDTEIGEVILNISDISIIKDEDGKTVNLSDLKKGGKLSVEYSPVMTRSLPPINNPVKVIVG